MAASGHLPISDDSARQATADHWIYGAVALARCYPTRLCVRYASGRTSTPSPSRASCCVAPYHPLFAKVRFSVSRAVSLNRRMRSHRVIFRDRVRPQVIRIVRWMSKSVLWNRRDGSAAVFGFDLVNGRGWCPRHARTPLCYIWANGSRNTQ